MDYNSKTSSSVFSVPAGYKEALPPELFKYTEKGQELRGIFIRGEYVKFENDRVLEVYLQTNRGMVKFRPGIDVRQKLSKDMIGKHLIIRYIGDDEAKGREGNALKVFGVYYAEDKLKSEDDLGIGDDDIPF